MNSLDYAEIMNASDRKREEVGFEALSEAEKIVSLFSCSRFEIEMGGLGLFYYNSAGDYAVETVWAYETIGAHRTAEILRQANALFRDGTPPRDGDARFDALQVIRDQDEDVLGSLTSEFYEASTAEDTDGLIETYINQHWSSDQGDR